MLIMKQMLITIIQKRIHYIRPYQCIDCGEKFKSEYNLERQRRKTHTLQTEVAEMKEE